MFGVGSVGSEEGIAPNSKPKLRPKPQANARTNEPDKRRVGPCMPAAQGTKNRSFNDITAPVQIGRTITT